MSVRAKFKCDSVIIVKYSSGASATIELSPVTSGSDENKAFFAATPSGSIKLQTINEEAAKEFIPGKAYYVDFVVADN